jgi:DNA-binding HxlR family transcriptional regulator
MTTPLFKKAPFCWQDKRVLRRIREQCQDAGSAISVYNALTEIDSDTGGKGVFTTTHGWIAKLSGTSDRTVRRRLDELEQAGIVKVTTPPLRAPCTYELLAFGNDGRTMGHNGRTFGHETSTPWPTSEVKKERSTEATKPLSPTERISADRQVKELIGTISDLKAKMEWDTFKTPENQTKLEELQETKTRLESRLAL